MKNDGSLTTLLLSSNVNVTRTGRGFYVSGNRADFYRFSIKKGGVYNGFLARPGSIDVAVALMPTIFETLLLLRVAEYPFTRARKIWANP